MELKDQELSSDRSSAPTRSFSSRVWSALRVMRRRQWLRPKRIGCLLVVLVIAATWLVSWINEELNSVFSPPPVRGNPFSPVAPVRPASSGSLTLDRITQRGMLIVAVQEAPGLAQRSSVPGGYTGFDIEIVKLIAHDLAVDPARTHFKPLPPRTRESALKRGEVDLILGGYEITATPDTQVTIAGPYLVHQSRLAVPAASSVRGLSSLGPRKICAPSGSPATAALVERGIAVQTRATLAACAELLGNRIEAIAGDQAEISAVLSRAPGTLRVLEEQLGRTEYGIGLPPGDLVLRDRITGTLRQAIDDGTWDRLYAQYFGRPVPSPPALR